MRMAGPNWWVWAPRPSFQAFPPTGAVGSTSSHGFVPRAVPRRRPAEPVRARARRPRAARPPRRASTPPAARATFRSPTSSADYLDRPGVRDHPESVRRRRQDQPRSWRPDPRRDDREGLVLSGHMDVVPADGARMAVRSVHADRRGRPVRGPRHGRHEGVPRARGQPARGGRRLRPPAAAGRSSSPTTRRSAPSAPGASPRPGAALDRLPRRRRHRRADRAPRGSARTRGMLRLRLAFTGRAAHSGLSPSRPERDRAGRPRRSSPCRSCAASSSASGRPTASTFPEVPFVALNVGTVAGGSAANVIPDRCEVAPRHPACCPACRPEAIVDAGPRGGARARSASRSCSSR